MTIVTVRLKPFFLCVCVYFGTTARKNPVDRFYQDDATHRIVRTNNTERNVRMRKMSNIVAVTHLANESSVRGRASIGVAVQIA